MRRAMISMLLAVPLAIASPAMGDPPADADLLRGPAVEDNGVPGAPGSFGETMAEKAGGVGEARVGHRLFMEAVRLLDGEGAPAGAALTREQRAKIREISRAYRSELRAFREAHPEDAALLSRMRGEGRKSATEAEVELAREAMGRLPSEAPYHEQIWAELTGDQQELVREEIDRAVGERLEARRMERERERARDRFERSGREDGDRAGQGQGQGRGQGRGKGDGARIRELLKNPATRERALERIRARIERMPQDERAKAEQRLRALLDQIDREVEDRPAPSGDGRG